MCEPAHSIVQFPDDFDDSDLPFGGQMSKESRLRIIFNKLGATAKKIGKWFHISKMGAGHSLALGASHRELLYLPANFQYEGTWWRKEFDCDSPINCEDSFKAAKEYHNLVCMGDIRKFRTFLETSMNKTDRLDMYVERFLDILRPNAREMLWKKVKSIAKIYRKISKTDRDKVIKSVMGYTRRRNLFVPEWADDSKFWGG